MDPDVWAPLPEALLLQCRDSHRDLQDRVSHVRHLRGGARWGSVLGRGCWWSQPRWDPGEGWFLGHLRPGCSSSREGRAKEGEFLCLLCCFVWLHWAVVSCSGDAGSGPVPVSLGSAGCSWHGSATPLGTLGSRVGTAGLPLCWTDSWFSLPSPLLQPHDIRAQVSAAHVPLCAWTLPPCPPSLSPHPVPPRATLCFVPPQPQCQHSTACPYGREILAEPQHSGKSPQCPD